MLYEIKLSIPASPALYDTMWSLGFALGADHKNELVTNVAFFACTYNNIMNLITRPRLHFVLQTH